MKARKNKAFLLISLALYFLMSLPIQAISDIITSKQSGNWKDQATWYKRVPTENDDVVISGHSILINTDQLCKSIRIVADTDSDTKLAVVDGDLQVIEHFVVEVENQNKHTDVEIKGTGSLNIAGYVLFERSINNNQMARMQLHISENGQMNILDNFEFSYGAAHRKENNQEIWLEHHAQLNIQGSLTFEQIKHGRDAQLLLTDNALMTVDRHMFIAHFIGERVKVNLRDQSTIAIRGSLAFYHGYFITDDYSYIDLYDGSTLSVAGDFEIYPRGSKTIMYIRLHQNSTVHIRGRLIVYKTGWDNLRIQLNDYSCFSIGGLGLKENTGGTTRSFNVTGGRTNITLVKKDLVAIPKYKSAALMD